jgi:hypothetical protein
MAATAVGCVSRNKKLKMILMIVGWEEADHGSRARQGIIRHNGVSWMPEIVISGFVEIAELLNPVPLFFIRGTQFRYIISPSFLCISTGASILSVGKHIRTQTNT